MGIIGLIFTFIVVWFLIILVRVVWRVYSSYRSIKNSFKGTPFDRQQGREESRGSAWYKWGSSKKSKKKKNKIIPTDYGEYVEFTETPDTPSTQSKKPDTTVYKESQVEDAEWEEMK